MNKQMHPLVELMLKRMESHPEEFMGGPENIVYPTYDTPLSNRWDCILSEMKDCMTEEEEVAVNTALGAIRMERLHNEALDELLNGDERRRKQAEERERAGQAHKAHSQYGAHLSHAYQSNQYAAQLANTLGALGTNSQQSALGGLLNSGSLKYQPGPDVYEEVNTGMRYTRAHLEDNPGLVAKMKKALGL